MTDALLLFAKPPVAGKVKTRLIPQLGAETATRVHEALLQHTASVFNRCQNVQKQLWAGFDLQHSAFSDPGFDVWSKHLQTQGDLGRRMQQAIEFNLQRYDKVVITGSDCPVINPEYISAAFAALEEGAPIVFGPAEDGGYVLVGASENVPAIFENIDWGTEAVLQQSRQQLQQQGVAWKELETLWDVDHPEDVKRWQSD
ncbi:TIGR04282 family arsenosugar biosynthesis glycosyltransferase [Aestuariirhabdus sp. Z084]|uniref:TIGR04282 family arsenosugar biosynthesis glycosyltransferase n=1 Tax=Aestuariirhabdus haliotis TaxID=2918751 RepID=UPI00201B35EF|nr:TIGR04282 family arsenosugar biosynthesis glycosyltransferase [Aestuariirhabdus haliotis]MCL6414433.1 TIGR04282 family arsenosugar biosynthesis glycosyltransferase [Aestuariirhabdus haliotis]MCL6418585.1 TIGR04282 family arsenosugar biosynthesis glycosyltransferase [Aestuariirhabdus haliotis]